MIVADVQEPGQVRVFFRRVESLLHPPENDDVYKPICLDDPAVLSLAESVRKHGVKEPLIVTLDNYVLSGNRRLVASRLAGLAEVPCILEPITRADPKFLLMLTECNRQRVKTADELAREAVVAVNADDAHRQLRQYRVAAAMGDFEPIDIEGEVKRHKISGAKKPMLLAALSVISARRRFWPLTLRSVHYALLNDPPMRNAGGRGKRYANDLHSYKDLSDLLIRARLEGALTWDAIDDPTRPVTVWDVHRAVGTYVEREVGGFLKSYWRDLQQSQPRHLEIVGEKNTIANVIRPVASDYCIPMTLGRGYCSGSPRKKIVERFEASGRDSLVLLVLSDFDPEGEDVAHSLARSLRDEFDVPDVCLVKVTLTAEQVKEYNLPTVLTAKKGSSRRKKFVEKYGEAVHELEALSPEVMQLLLRDAVQSVLDVDAFDAELAAEREDAAALERLRRQMLSGAGS